MLESQSPENWVQNRSSLLVLASRPGGKQPHDSSPVGKRVQVRKGTWLDHSGLICMKEAVIFLLKWYVLSNFKVASNTGARECLDRRTKLTFSG